MSHEPRAEGSEHQVPASASPLAPAFALLAHDGYAVATTDVFIWLVGLSALNAPAVATAVAEITNGHSETVAFEVTLLDGRLAQGSAQAANDLHARLILLEVSVPRPGTGQDELTDWFARFIDDSNAIVWLKDLEGRYLHVNAQYSEELGIGLDRLRGRSDAELSQSDVIDSSRNRRAGGPEPLALEYVIPAFDHRPSYAAMRFPIPDATGAPVAVCGVASPADQAGIANRESERLLAVLEWLNAEPAAVRRMVLSNWGVTPVPPQGSAGAVATQMSVEPAPARAPAQTQEPAELEQRMRRVSEQLSASEAQVLDLQSALGSAREQMTRLERALAAATAGAARLTPPVEGPPTLQLGWDAEAQTLLGEGLSGCLNVRSIFSEAVRLIGSGGGWDAVFAWLLGDEDGRLGCAATWVRSPVDRASLETAMSQIRLSPSASAVGAVAHSGERAWLGDPSVTGDTHLAQRSDDGIATVVLLPIRRADITVAVLELCSHARADPSAAADAALESIQTEVGAACQRVTVAASASRWGRRSR